MKKSTEVTSGDTFYEVERSILFEHTLSRDRSATCLARNIRHGDSIYSQEISPCFIMTWRNLMTTFELGRNRTCLFPLFSALYMVFKASCKTLTSTMMPGQTPTISNTQMVFLSWLKLQIPSAPNSSLCSPCSMHDRCIRQLYNLLNDHFAGLRAIVFTTLGYLFRLILVSMACACLLEHRSCT